MSSLVFREREEISKFGKYHWFQYLELWHTSGLRHGHTMATTTLGLTRYSVLINIKCLKWSSIHINDVVLIGRSKTELFWYRKMAHFAIKLPKFRFPLKVLLGLKIVSEPVILYRFLRDNGARQIRCRFEQGMLVIPGSFSCLHLSIIHLF